MYELLNNKCIDDIIKEGKDFNDYLTDYCKIIDNGINRGLDKSLIKYYTEKHHILPRCVKGEDEDYNYVLLTALEHIISHILLYRMYPDEIGFYLAVGMMIGMGKDKYSSSIVSKNRVNALRQINSNVISELKDNFTSKSKKIVVCFDIKSYEVVKIYNGVTTAKEDGIPYRNIGTVLSGKRHSTGGYGWMTLRDYQKKHDDLLKNYYDKVLNGYVPTVNYSSENVLRAKKHFISPAYKKLVCLDINHNIVKIYDSLVDTEKDGFSVPLLSKALNGKSTKENFHRGYYWEFYDKFIQTNEKDLKIFNLNQKSQTINAIRKEDRIICCDNNLNILKIYESLIKTVEDGFCHTTICNYLDSDIMFRGYIWYRYSSWTDLSKVNECYSKTKDNIPKINPINLSNDPIKVVKCDCNLKILEIYDNIHKAGKENGISFKGISKAINRKHNQFYKGFYWSKFTEFIQTYPDKYKDFKDNSNE